MSYYSLAPLNAILNGTAGLLLLAGFYFIKQKPKRVRAHRACMLAAFGVSIAFLISYVTFHYHVGDVLFPGHGWIRPVYFSILIPHIILATAIVPLAITTLYFGLRGRFPSHRRIARWTWPAWIFVSATGVIIYLLLFKLYTPKLPPLH